MTIEEIGKYLKENVKGMSKEQGEQAYKALVDLVIEKANEDKDAEEVKVALPRLGNLNIRKRAAYKGKNPSNGKEVEVAASRRATLTPYESFKKAING